MTQPNEPERPDFESYRDLIDADRVGRGLSRIAPPQFATLSLNLSCSAISIFAISPWCELAGLERIGIVVGLVCVSFVHSIMVHRGHAKTINKSEDDPP